MKAIGPGSLVRCIDDAWPDYAPLYAQKVPVRGHVYTVRQIHPVSTVTNEEGLLLCEIVNDPVHWRIGDAAGYGEPNFRISRFVPVDDGEIRIFRDLAANPKEKVPA